MGYNVLDIIDKAKNIQKRKKTIIKSVVTGNKSIPVLDLMSKVLCNKTDEIINYYDTLKDEISDIRSEEIKIITYDKICFLINEFNNKIYDVNIKNGKDYLKFSLDLTKDIYSLFMYIQGRLVNDLNDIDTKTYYILSKIIKNINKEIQSIEKAIS